MKTREERLDAGTSLYDIMSAERAENVFNYALDIIKKDLSNAPSHLQYKMTFELLEAAAGKR